MVDHLDRRPRVSAATHVKLRVGPPGNGTATNRAGPRPKRAEAIPVAAR
jgi:hypothetical protein